MADDQDKTSEQVPDTRGGPPATVSPALPSGGIVRENPFNPPSNGPMVMQGDQATVPVPRMTASPINQNQYAQYQVSAGDTRKDILNKQAKVEGAEQLANADINQKAAEENARRIAEERQMMQQAMVDATNRDEALKSQIRQASAERIDPEHWWNSKSTGGKVLAGIGMVLGGIGGGLAKTGRNPAMDVMNKAIDEDINAQRVHIENSWKAIATQHGLDNDAFNRELHRQSWENNYRTAGLENIKYQLAANAAKSNSEMVKINAAKGIQDITDQQMKIRNDQWKLGVAAANAEGARMRELQKAANEQTMKLVEKEGVSFEDAQKAVYADPRFRPLTMNKNYAPDFVLQEQALRTQAASEMKVLTSKGMPADQAAQTVLSQPKYESLIKQPGVVVPMQKGAETTKDLDSRTVGYNNGERVLAGSAQQAEEYKAKMGAAQQWDQNVKKLQDLNEAAKKQGGLSTGQVAEWNATKNDMISIYGVMKEGSKRLPNEAEAKRLAEEVIGNPPNGSLFSNQWGTSLSPSDMGSKVDARLGNLGSIGTEARKAANLALQQSAGPSAPTAGTPNTAKAPDVAPPSYFKPAEKK